MIGLAALALLGCGPSTPGTAPAGACEANAVTCIAEDGGQTAYTCQQNQWVKYEACEFACAEGVGCAACTPYQSTCDAGGEHVCRADGSGYDTNECDPVQGMTCDATAGRCAGACALATLGASYVGCEYYPTISSNDFLPPGFDFGIIIANVSGVAAQVRLEAVAGGTPDSFEVAAHGVAVKRVPMARGTVYRLRSDQPLVAYQFNPLDYANGLENSYTNDASLLLPRNALGTNYMVAAWPGWSTAGSGGLVSITAAQDNTKVQLVTSATAFPFGAPGQTYDRTLDRGENLELISDDVGDLTGTRITSDKPVQVIGGHNCTNVPADVPACDHLEEVMFPTNTLGKTYIASAPQGLSTAAAFITRVIALEDATSVSYQPAVAGAATSLAHAGEIIEFQTDQDIAITGSKRVMVVQYMLGFELIGTGDPAMALATPVEQWRTSYLFHAPVNYVSNYVNVIAPTGATVLLDGMPIAGFEAIAGSGWAVARVLLSNSGDGNHEMSATLPFGISVYGYGDYTSYWYPGGLDLEPVGVD